MDGGSDSQRPSVKKIWVLSFGQLAVYFLFIALLRKSCSNCSFKHKSTTNYTSVSNLDPCELRAAIKNVKKNLDLGQLDRVSMVKWLIFPNYQSNKSPYFHHKSSSRLDIQIDSTARSF